MNLYEKYSEEDIEKVEHIIKKELIENDINDVCYGIIDIIAHISKSNIERFYRDNEVEEDDVDEIEEDDFGLLSQIKSKGFSLEEAIEIIVNDISIFEYIAEGIDEAVDYEEDDLLSRKENQDIISGVVLLLYNVEKNKAFTEGREDEINIQALDVIKEVINRKISKMNNEDFMILITRYPLADVLMTDDILVATIVNKIEEMDNAEFVYYLRNVKVNDKTQHSIIDEEEKKALKANSSYVDYIFNASRKQTNNMIIRYRHDAFTVAAMENLKYGAIKKIADENRKKIKKENQESGKQMGGFIDDITESALEKRGEYQMFLRMLGSINKKEFVCYMLRNGNDPLFKYGNEQAIIEKRLKEMSLDDLTMLVERLGQWEFDFPVPGENRDENVILKVAKERGLVNKDNKKTYSNEDKENAIERFAKYENLMINSIIQIRRATNQEDDEMIQEDYRETKYGRYVEEIQEVISIHRKIENLSELSDKEVAKLINDYNNNVSQEEAENEYECFTSFFEFKLLSLPSVYSYAFKMTGNGCLEDMMELKIEEFNEDFEKYKKERKMDEIIDGVAKKRREQIVRNDKLQQKEPDEPDENDK